MKTNKPIFKKTFPMIYIKKQLNQLIIYLTETYMSISYTKLQLTKLYKTKDGNF